MNRDYKNVLKALVNLSWLVIAGSKLHKQITSAISALQRMDDRILQLENALEETRLDAQDREDAR